ncbi:glycosyl hydrolase [Dyadobacter fanqingshengii]|uniref:Glycoside hydrolase n=1 Tax=Dyadobacter fanqingshengii TaxID=2906443 RepID=A0A9X1TA86_9BACT|nr:glycosyl hydrolase [Dyadobacter fanqingshengii]MCF0042275.1 glycoside hydrolase [Dyadobacter fanqingshengii]USJ35196.1 glycoside hydrolase [Dyadobacter fanqingshengii]
MRLILFLLLFLNGALANAQAISTSKPWTFWWWMGSAVNKKDITVQLEYFQKSGVGGVHIIPIYEVKGYESQSVPFLTPQWLDLVQHTVREGKRLDLGVDLTTGTGWPFGGPNVTPELGAKNMTVKNNELSIQPTKQKVKRAAPGGEGLVLDPFHATAMSRYLTRFDSAFARKKDLPRSMYNDSYEAYGANWTDDFLEEFKKRRGYELGENLALLTDSTGKAGSELVRIDYHQTLSELLRERYAKPWTDWNTKHGFLTRYQAHGSPGNLLDLYDAADIPETESFGTSRFSIPGLRIDPDYSIDQFGTPDPLAMKFASSAAHFSGKKLVSSETGTWLANHFKVSLSQVKPQIDELFTAGINHIFYHGSTYSPVQEPYPGWLFYASTNFGSTSHFAEHFSLLNKYVQRCQELLQNSKSDNDVLVYFPIHDLWATKAKSSGNVHLLEVHHVDRWLLDLPFGKLTQQLWKKGFGFDYVSDLQLSRLKLDGNGNLTSGNAVYKSLIIPVSTYMPEETLNELQRLAAKGAKIIFQNHFPEKATGYSTGPEKQSSFLDELTKLKKEKNVRVSDDFEKELIASGALRESFAEEGLTFIRKKTQDNKRLYFVANLGDHFKEGWVKVNITGAFEKLDALDEEASWEPLSRNGSSIYLKLLPGQSCFLRESVKDAGPEQHSIANKELEIKGNWNLQFLKGRPSIPATANLNELKTWTSLSDSAVYFSGTARYEIHFDCPDNVLKSGLKILDLGDVREVAAVKLNGKPIGTAWSIPFQLSISDKLKAKDNVLEIEVTNLSANYMRLRDTQKPDWKKFHDINIVDITYKKFDATKWEPMPSGLLGPVKILFR